MCQLVYVCVSMCISLCFQYMCQRMGTLLCFQYTDAVYVRGGVCMYLGCRRLSAGGMKVSVDLGPGFSNGPFLGLCIDVQGLNPGALEWGEVKGIAGHTPFFCLPGVMLGGWSNKIRGPRGFKLPNFVSRLSARANLRRNFGPENPVLCPKKRRRGVNPREKGDTRKEPPRTPDRRTRPLFLGTTNTGGRQTFLPGERRNNTSCHRRGRGGPTQRRMFPHRRGAKQYCIGGRKNTRGW